jgi:hypothetical protein
MTVSDLAKIAEAAENNYTCFGVRHHHTTASVGDELPKSWQQIDDEEDYELNGSCCLEFVVDNGEEELEFLIQELKSRNYQDGTIVLVAGDCFEYGNDDGEIIISNPIVIGTI